MCICFLLLFFEFIFLSAAEIINRKLKCITCFADMFSPLEEGVKLARNFLIFRNGKAEKMREFLETQRDKKPNL